MKPNMGDKSQTHQRNQIVSCVFPFRRATYHWVLKLPAVELGISSNQDGRAKRPPHRNRLEPMMVRLHPYLRGAKVYQLGDESDCDVKSGMAEHLGKYSLD